MKLERISLENFRNYKKTEVETSSDLVLILGENASGKTNFLESVYFLATLKSFRSPDNILVKTGDDYFRIIASAEGKIFEASVQINPAPKKLFKIDGQKVSRPFWKSFAAVLFTPSDLNMFALGPSQRRKFLDETISQIKKDYASDLVSLDHVLKQRSSLFEKIFRQEAERSELEIWDMQLSELALKITTARSEFLKFVDERFGMVYKNQTSFENQFAIGYKKCAGNMEEFLNHLKSLREAEIRSGTNLLGPHREDFIIQKDGQLNVYNSSQGELRSQILTLKLLQAEYLDSNGLPPIVLLDDVFSELDETRRAKLLESLGKFQIFITSTEEHHLPKLKQNSLVLKVSENQIK